MSSDYKYDVDYSFTWNHRIVKKTYEFEGSLCEDFYIMEVQYRDGIPSSYCDPFVSAESLQELEKVADRIKGAFSKPVLVMEDFPDLKAEELDDNA
jgi:hypothetical protein